MTSFSEDKLFKNVNSEDARILLDILDVNTVKIKIWTKELRLMDPKDYVPDIILELDFENLIIELQSTPVDDDFSRRGLTYVAVADRNKNNEKIMKLMVLTTAEDSKTVKHNFSEGSVFSYHVVSLKDVDAKEIIKTVEPKIVKGEKLTGKEIVLYALVPMIVEKNMEKYIKRVVHNLMQLRNSSDSIINLAFGVEWLIVDKFIDEEEERNILCDALGGRMSLIYEYGDRREKKGMKEILLGLINSGDSLTDISQKTGKSVEELEDILATD